MAAAESRRESIGAAGTASAEDTGSSSRVQEATPRPPTTVFEGASRLSVSELRRGLAGNHLVSSADYEIGGATRGPGSPSGTQAEKKLKAKRRKDAHEFSIALRDDELARRARFGRAPYENETFQMLGQLTGAFRVNYGGRDFAVPASPEASLEWYLKRFKERFKSPIDGRVRREAIARLREWQDRRKSLLGSIGRLVLADIAERTERGTWRDDLYGYAILEGKLVLIHSGDDAELEALDRAYRAFSSDWYNRVQSLLK